MSYRFYSKKSSPDSMVVNKLAGIDQFSGVGFVSQSHTRNVSHYQTVRKGPTMNFITPNKSAVLDTSISPNQSPTSAGAPSLQQADGFQSEKQGQQSVLASASTSIIVVDWEHDLFQQYQKQNPKGEQKQQVLQRKATISARASPIPRNQVKKSSIQKQR